MADGQEQRFRDKGTGASVQGYKANGKACLAKVHRGKDIRTMTQGFGHRGRGQTQGHRGKSTGVRAHGEKAPS